jgi:hypothetical protein
MYSILDKLKQSKQLEFDSEREKKPYYYDDADKWDEYPLPKAKPSDKDAYEAKPLPNKMENLSEGALKNLLKYFDGSPEWLDALNKQLRHKIDARKLKDLKWKAGDKDSSGKLLTDPRLVPKIKTKKKVDESDLAENIVVDMVKYLATHKPKTKPKYDLRHPDDPTGVESFAELMKGKLPAQQSRHNRKRTNLAVRELKNRENQYVAKNAKSHQIFGTQPSTTEVIKGIEDLQKRRINALLGKTNGTAVTKVSKNTARNRKRRGGRTRK